MTLWLVTRVIHCCSCCCRGWCSSAGRDLLAVSLDADRHVWFSQRETQLLVSLAQGIGAIFGGLLASQLHDATRSWVSVFFLLWQSRPI